MPHCRSRWRRWKHHRHRRCRCCCCCCRHHRLHCKFVSTQKANDTKNLNEVYLLLLCSMIRRWRRRRRDDDDVNAKNRKKRTKTNRIVANCVSRCVFCTWVMIPCASIKWKWEKLNYIRLFLLVRKSNYSVRSPPHWLYYYYVHTNPTPIQHATRNVRMPQNVDYDDGEGVGGRTERERRLDSMILSIENRPHVASSRAVSASCWIIFRYWSGSTFYYVYISWS